MPTGSFWREPLPLERARAAGPLLALRPAAAAAAGVATHPSEAPVAARVLATPAAALVIVVNESSADARRRVSVDGAAFDVPVPAGGARMALIDRKTGSVLAATPGGTVERAR
jgi:hypothetical protein